MNNINKSVNKQRRKAGCAFGAYLYLYKVDHVFFL